MNRRADVIAQENNWFFVFFDCIMNESGGKVVQ